MAITERTLGRNLCKINAGVYVVIDGKIRCKRTFVRADFKTVTMSHLFARGYVYVSNSHLVLTASGVHVSNIWSEANPKQAHDLYNPKEVWEKRNPHLAWETRRIRGLRRNDI